MAPVPFGAQTPAGILALQRQAGNRSVTAFVQRPSADRDPGRAPAAGPTTAPAVQRGILSFIGDGSAAVGLHRSLTPWRASLVTLAVIQALLGYTSEHRFLRYACAHLRGLFPTCRNGRPTTNGSATPAR